TGSECSTISKAGLLRLRESRRLSLEYTDPKILIKPESPTPGLQTMIDDIKTLKNSQGLLETRKDSERFRKTPKDSERLRNFISGCLNLNK
ncbi:hypothetical protein PV328_004844, partial [Microctonus aethiopoides]